MLVFFALMGAEAWATELRIDWKPPADGVVRDSRAAISIARAVWISMNPKLAQGIGSEEVWQSGMVAVLHDGVWEVSSKMKPNEIGGALFIYVSQKDARIVDIYLTQ